MTEMFPVRDGAVVEADERTSAWLTKAKGLYQADKKVEPFSFQPEVRHLVFNFPHANGVASLWSS